MRGWCFVAGMLACTAGTRAGTWGCILHQCFACAALAAAQASCVVCVCRSACVGCGAVCRYDKMSARELFRQWGVSQRCYEEVRDPRSCFAHGWAPGRGGVRLLCTQRPQGSNCVCLACSCLTLSWLPGVVVLCCCAYAVLWMQFLRPTLLVGLFAPPEDIR